MTATLEGKEKTRMARSWTVGEVLEGWVRHDKAMLDGKDGEVRLPIGKQSRYYKSPPESVDLDLGAWNRVNRFALTDAEVVRTCRTHTGRLWDALTEDLARCPYPCDPPENDPPMPSLPESVVLRHRRLSTTGRAIAARLYRGRK